MPKSKKLTQPFRFYIDIWINEYGSIILLMGGYTVCSAQIYVILGWFSLHLSAFYPFYMYNEWPVCALYSWVFHGRDDIFIFSELNLFLSVRFLMTEVLITNDWKCSKEGFNTGKFTSRGKGLKEDFPSAGGLVCLRWPLKVLIIVHVAEVGRW